MADLGIVHQFRGCSVKVRDSLQIVLPTINLQRSTLCLLILFFLFFFYFYFFFSGWMEGEKDAMYFHLKSLISPQKLSCSRGYESKVFIQIIFHRDGVSRI